jgi:hypothetical protein
LNTSSLPPSAWYYPYRPIGRRQQLAARPERFSASGQKTSIIGAAKQH